MPSRFQLLFSLILLAVLFGLRVPWWASRPVVSDPAPTAGAPAAARPIVTAAPILISRQRVPSGADEVVGAGEAGTEGGARDGGWVVRGRCIDESGTPIAEVVAALDGVPYGASGRAWNTIAPQQTAVDGRFAFRIAIPRAFRVTLGLAGPGLVAVSRSWAAEERARTVDLGDVVLRPGCAVRGFVVDNRGRPQADVGVALYPRGDSSPEPKRYERRSDATRSGPDGAFRLRPLAAGNLRVRLSGAVLRSPRTVELPAAADHFVQIVVESAEDWPSIRGVVVDPGGQPVAGVRIASTPSTSASENRTTDAEGRFTVMLPANAPKAAAASPTQLHADVTGYLPFSSGRTFAWGSTGVRVVLTPLAGFDLLVTDGRRPVEGYALYIAEAPRSEVKRHLDFRLVDSRGPHAGGLVHVAGIRRGNFLLKVLPEDASLAESAFLAIRFGTEPSPLREVVLRKAATQRLRVVAGSEDSATVPVANARVELLEPIRDELVEPWTETFRRVPWISGDRAYEWLSGPTDGRGECALSGPPDVPLTIRVSGRGFATTLRRDVRLVTGGDPIVVRVEKVATVTGVIRPAELVTQIHEMAGGKTHGHRPGLRLVRGDETVPRQRGMRQGAPLGADGSFSIQDVPAGTWKLQLIQVRQRRDVTSATPWTIGLLRDLAGGEARHVEFDLARHVFARVRGNVYVDDAAVAGGALGLRRVDAADHIYVDVDRAGRYEVLVPSGRYAAYISGARLGIPLWVPAAELLVVAAGEPRNADLHGHTRRVILHAVDSRGVGVPGVRLWASCEREPWTELRRTAEKGVCSVRLPIGRFELWVSPKGDKSAAKRVRLQVLDVRPGTVPHELRLELPDGLGY